MIRPLKPGVWGVVATPFLGEGKGVDHGSLARLVRHYEEIGASGLTVLGVFGEAASLGNDERRDVLATVVASVALPLVVGVTSLSTRPAIDEVTQIQSVVGDRLAGAMVQLNSADPSTLGRHLTAVHEATGAGIVAQNYPVASGVSIDLASEIAALDGVPGLVAIKAEAAPTARRIAALKGHFTIPIFGGLGGVSLIDELSLGASGAMTGFSYPEGLIATFLAHRESGFEGARAALLPYLPLINFEQQPAIALAIRKECLVIRGLFASATVRSPAPALPPVLREQLKRHMDAVEQFRSSENKRAVA